MAKKAKVKRQKAKKEGKGEKGKKGKSRVGLGVGGRVFCSELSESGG